MSRREQNEEQWKSKQFKNLSKHLFAKFEWGSGRQKRKADLIECSPASHGGPRGSSYPTDKVNPGMDHREKSNPAET